MVSFKAGRSRKVETNGLLEEFKDKVRPDIRSHLDGGTGESSILADDYGLTHKMSSKSGNKQQKSTEAYLGHQEKKIINLPGQDNYLARAR